MNLMRRFARNGAAVAGAAFLLALVLAAILAPAYAPDGPWALDNTPLLEPFVSAQAPLGTDSLGRDTLAGLLYGARISLTVGLVSAATATLIGIIVGAVAGYYRGIADDILMRLTEFVQTIPSMIFSIVLVAILRPSIVSIIIAIAVVSWPPVARLVRGQFLALRSREFVEAAVVTRAAGAYHHVPRDLAQCDRACGRAGFADGRQRDPARKRHQFSGTWRPQPGQLGLHDWSVA